MTTGDCSPTAGCGPRWSNLASPTTTAAGDGHAGFAGDGGPPEKAEFNDPSGVFVDRTGVLYIADTLNHCIRAAKMPS